MKKTLFILVSLLTVCGVCDAQSERGSVRKGNRDFGKSRFEEAEINYKKALVADSTSVAADYNLGNTYFRLENYTEAEKYYGAAADSLSKGRYGADIYHNMGNSLLARQDYQGAIEAYKNALRRRPDDMETKSNLAYAQKMLQNQQNQQDQNQQNQNQDQQDQNKDQNQDKQNQDQDKDKDRNKDNQNQDKEQNKDNQEKNDSQNRQNQDNQDSREQQGQQPKISPQAAQQMLQAIQDQEKETQDKVKKEKALQMRSKQKEKNW